MRSDRTAVRTVETTAEGPGRGRAAAARAARREGRALRSLRLELDRYREVADFDAYLYAAHEAEELARALAEGRAGARARLLALRGRLRRAAGPRRA